MGARHLWSSALGGGSILKALHTLLHVCACELLVKRDGLNIMRSVEVVEAAEVAVLRPPHACDAWSEYALCAKAAESPSASSSFAEGHSLFQVPALMSQEECQSLILAGHRVRPASMSGSTVRLGIHDAALSFTPEEQRCVRAILDRALSLIEAMLPELAEALFGQRTALHTMELFYAQNEPAINIYSAGGELIPHRDKHRLSVLVPLTPPESFSGGGTGFWPEADCAGRRVRRGCEAAKHMLKPSAGSAMLFGGEVMHAALPVTAGTRVVLVASLTPRAFRFGVRLGAEGAPPLSRRSRSSSEERLVQAAADGIASLDTNASPCA